jgi:predicted metal-dependent HD superfamily phosphohydrolase
MSELEAKIIFLFRELSIDRDRHKNKLIINSIYHKYSGFGDRYYHNKYHICDVLNEFDKYVYNTGYNQNNLEIQFALLFHDVIYDIPNFDKLSNEEKSAQFFETVVNCIPELNQLDTELVANLIRSTEYSNPDKKPDQNFSIEYQLVHDIDFSSLGKDWKTFVRNNENIKDEFWYVDDDILSIGRNKFLEGLLNQKTLYLTKCFQDKYEEQARENIKKLLDLK